MLFREIGSRESEDQIAFRDGTRRVARLVRAEAPLPRTAEFSPEGTYLITGGLGALGLRTARWLAEHGARHLVLLGRGGLPPGDQWDGLPQDSRTRRQVEAIRGIEQLGARLEVVAADVADLQQMSGVFARISDTGPPIRGVIHAAGVADYQPIGGMSTEAFGRVLRPKVLGAWVLRHLTWQLDLDFLVCYSSTASLWGVKGQGHYAAANRFLDAFAHDCRAAGTPVLTVNWGLWSGGGMVDEAYRAWLAEAGMEQPESEPAFDEFGGREDESYRAWLSKIGVEQLQPRQAFDALARLLGSVASNGAAGNGAAGNGQRCIVQATVAEVDWEKFSPVGRLNSRPPLLEQVLGEPVQGPPANSQQSAAQCRELLRQLRRASNRRRHAMLMTYFREQISQVLGLDSSQLDVDQPLNTVGLDSLMAIELRNQVKTDLGVDVPMVAFIEGPSVSRMATLIGEQLAAAGGNGAASRGGPSSTPEEGSPAGRNGNGRQQASTKQLREPEWIEGEI